MVERAAKITGFLQCTAWADWNRQPLAGDASGRRYERLIDGNDSVILMDAPPENGEGTRGFAAIASLLRDIGLHPPDVLFHDAELGAMILSDLGRQDFARWLAAHPTDTNHLYRAAIDVLVLLHGRSSDLPLKTMTPVVGGQMIGLATTHYAGATGTDLMDEMQTALQNCCPVADTLALRDYHVENLIWRADQTGLARVGLLDFQDTFIAPAGYDLASLIRDARRDVDPMIAAEMTEYFMSNTNQPERFVAQLACLGAQRNLRILGIFARLSLEQAKHSYVDLIPRVWRNLMLDLAHPELTNLQQAVRDTLPIPDDATLARLRA